ncbi:MAG TPA: carboxymuconolactone decarboxylase family protein [Planctomycetota bacterium]|nr:carboxymuconolactone decarboxylase family protein [Planctomycetota bacterium]
MTREQVYSEIENTLGLVPAMFKTLPEADVEAEWLAFRHTQCDAGAIDNKNRELIGLALSAVTKCKYCIFFHTEMARLYGASDAEIEEAVRFAKSSVGWSAYISGLQIDFEQFKREVREICDYARRQASEHQVSPPPPQPSAQQKPPEPKQSAERMVDAEMEVAHESGGYS